MVAHGAMDPLHLNAVTWNVHPSSLDSYDSFGSVAAVSVNSYHLYESVKIIVANKYLNELQDILSFYTELGDTISTISMEIVSYIPNTIEHVTKNIMMPAVLRGKYRQNSVNVPDDKLNRKQWFDHKR
eukprot:31388_1